jgi:hypothetical protein
MTNLLQSAGFASAEQFLSLALWLAGAGHFCVLIASFQVPHRLGWKEDLTKLTSFNRKLMWVHGGFAVLTIVAFGILTLTLHGDIMHGEKSAMGLTAFIGIYWATRIIVDFTYYEHKDWPRGRGFVAGHILLTLLFAFLACTYLSVFVWRVWLG